MFPPSADAGSAGRPLRVLFVNPSLANNGVGRTYSLWLLTRELGWQATAHSPTSEPLWEPLRGTGFDDVCRAASPADITGEAARCDLVVVVKPEPGVLRLARTIRHRLGTPYLVDVDDPDLEVMTTWGGVPQILRNLASPRRFVAAMQLRRSLPQLPTTVSNPVLQQRYGGDVVPHVREDPGPGRPHRSRRPALAFVGTAWGHKGIAILRAAVARLQDEGFSLTVTAAAPHDARPWERWLGNTDLEAGLRLVHDCDIVALPTVPRGYGRAQLPVKLIDAMLAARAVAVSDAGPLPWAVGDGGLTFAAGSVDALVRALSDLRDPHRREQLGDRARRVALDRYVPAVVAPAFARVALAAVGNGRQRPTSR